MKILLAGLQTAFFCMQLLDMVTGVKPIPAWVVVFVTALTAASVTLLSILAYDDHKESP